MPTVRLSHLQVDFGSELEAALAGSEDGEDDDSEDDMLAFPSEMRAAVSRRRAEKDAWRAAAAEWMQGAAMPETGASKIDAALRAEQALEPCFADCMLSY